MPDPHVYVIDRIVATMDCYVRNFHLFDGLTILAAE
jgi:hypothetical protein